MASAWQIGIIFAGPAHLAAFSAYPGMNCLS
jgi:hypothetical protein